jgi:superkiller protein 3
LSLVAVVLVLLLAGAWISAYDVNPIRADIIYKVAQDSEKSNPQSDTIVALYEHAVQMAPGDDVYSNALGLAFRERAKDAKSNSASIFSDQTPPAAIVNQSPEQTAKLNRNDLLYASLTMLLRSRDLNPLIGEYAVNLARFYLPNLPIDTQAKLDLARQSDRYYAEAVRLSPNDIRVWNEWANFDLAYMTDDDAALAKVEKSIQLDPTFAPSYVALGTVYAEKHEFDQAAEAFHKALALDPNQTEAQSKLAFVYYQQGRDGESIQAYLKYIDLAQGAQNLWEAHKNLALIYQQTGNRAGAIHEGQIAADLAPRSYASQLTDWVNQLQGH